MQAGGKPPEAHKRTLELEASSEALGPAQKKRILDSSTAGAASSLKAEPASASHGQQNGVGAHEGSLAEMGEGFAAGQVMKQEGSTLVEVSPAGEAAPAGALSADGAGDVGLTEGSSAQAGNKQGGAAQEGIAARQEQQNGPFLSSAQHSRAATPELKIERLDASTGQVRSPHKGHMPPSQPCGSVLSLDLSFRSGLHCAVTPAV